ncbi:MAG TPA: hypothetical protein DCM55_07995 [Corynebacterium variabile]|nr:hypothetical protein [Corynebacterium variabile]
MVTVVVDGVVTSSYRYTTLEDVTRGGVRWSYRKEMTAPGWYTLTGMTGFISRQRVCSRI